MKEDTIIPCFKQIVIRKKETLKRKTDEKLKLIKIKCFS